MPNSKYHQNGDYSVGQRVTVENTNAFVQNVALDKGDGTIIGVAANPLVVTAANSTGTTQVVGNIANDAADSGNPVKIGGKASAAAPAAVADQDRVDAWFTRTGGLVVAGQATTSADGFSTSAVLFYNDSGVGRGLMVYPSVFNGSTWDRPRTPSATARLVSSAASNNATLVNGAKTWAFNILGYNSNAATRYLKLYNKATTPTVGTDVPVLTIPLAPSQSFNIQLSSYYFSTGCGFGLVTGSADADNTGVGAGDILGLNITYSA